MGEAAIVAHAPVRRSQTMVVRTMPAVIAAPAIPADLLRLSVAPMMDCRYSQKIIIKDNYIAGFRLVA